jgi:hypothetical protein
LRLRRCGHLIVTARLRLRVDGFGPRSTVL